MFTIWTGYQENKHLYTEEEYMFLCGQWVKEYEKYLMA